MFWNKRVVVGDAERALIYRNRRFERVLGPGVYRIGDWLGRTEVVLHDIAKPEYAGKDTDVLVAALGERLGDSFVLADIGVDQVGLVMKNGKLEDLLAPGSRELYWKGLVPIEIVAMTLSAGLELRGEIAQRLRQIGLLDRIAMAVTVPNESAGLLYVDGKLVRTLDAGSYAFWNFQKNVAVELVELRVQSVEVSGQELLTRDKVSLRVNLAASMRVTDPVAARSKVAKYSDYLYRELQYGLRKAVSAKTLDELLGDKASLDADIFGYVRGQVGELGMEVLGVGVKDVILPGEMKDILNGVVQAEKSAQANVIRRREEANATRSLLNTAKLIEDSPVLMRLKELEALEKVTEKIDKLTVFGGLDGVLKQLVSLKTSG
ncbi:MULTISPECIES: slipin family protein [unclassified Lysobacter]|uniref:slipin family protein n=1 Tax=unclassified Lysobacter TaxID=2635362 RepID=UPI0006FA4A54|nr:MULTISPECIES: slipin family protein [unclassified Lysobacter]KRC36658.1 stomatin/prohibitin-family membrane protease subunit [Lysobacter sp. Root76]KRD66753.1 stomatin/prohibitin-family membrane protease subunit [Lysobacter sp. Root96]